MKDKKYKKLIVWDKAMDFIEMLYKTTHKFPDTEIYGLTSQLRRASTSIALNIAEGSAGSSDVEYKRYLNIALRSSYEVMCGLELAQRLRFLEINEGDHLIKLCDEISAMIYGLKKCLSK